MPEMVKEGVIPLARNPQFAAAFGGCALAQVGLPTGRGNFEGTALALQKRAWADKIKARRS